LAEIDGKLGRVETGWRVTGGEWRGEGMGKWGSGEVGEWGISTKTPKP